MPQTTWLELEEARATRTQPARRPPRAARELPAALRAPVAATPVDPTPQPPSRARLLEHHRIALAVLAALSCLCLASRALDGSSSAMPFGGDPLAGAAGSTVSLADGVALNQDRIELTSLARLAALERAAAPTLEDERARSDKPSGGGSEGTPGEGGSGGSGSGPDGQPQPEPEPGLLPPLPAPLPDVDPDDLPELDPTGALPELPSATLPDLDPPLPTVPSPTELP